MSRYLSNVPRSEFERRWGLVRDRLRDQQIDALIVVGQSNEVDGGQRWLTDGSLGYRRVVVFHANELMSIIEHGESGSHRKFNGETPGYPGVGEVFGTPTFPSVDYTTTYEAKVVCDMVRERGYKRLALLHPKGIASGFIDILRLQLPDVELVDESESIDRFKAIKSAAEIEALERAAHLQDEVFERTVAFAKPGMRDRDIAAFIAHETKLLNGDYGVILVGSAPHGEPAYYRHSEQQGRVIGQGDTFSVLIENGSPEGYFVEVSRMVSVGPPSAELRDVFEQSREAQDFALSLLKPGVKASDVYAQFTDYLASRGFPPDKRIFSHGQGYDLVERPLIRWDENMILEEGMCLAVHPGLTANGAYSVICDNVVLEADGPRLIHRTPRRLFQI
jgi:Xaa-Pro aminopeptidase